MGGSLLLIWVVCAVIETSYSFLNRPGKRTIHAQTVLSSPNDFSVIQAYLVRRDRNADGLNLPESEKNRHETAKRPYSTISKNRRPLSRKIRPNLPRESYLLSSKKQRYNGEIDGRSMSDSEYGVEWNINRRKKNSGNGNDLYEELSHGTKRIKESGKLQEIDGDFAVKRTIAGEVFKDQETYHRRGEDEEEKRIRVSDTKDESLPQVDGKGKRFYKEKQSWKFVSGDRKRDQRYALIGMVEDDDFVQQGKVVA